MIAPKVLSQEEVTRLLEGAGFRNTGESFSGESGDFAIWVTSWGEPIMVPQAGPDKVCADFILRERMAEVLKTKPRK